MARSDTAKGKICRRFGVNLFENPKYDRLLSKRSHPPGMHGPNQRRRRRSDYGEQLDEKQKLKFAYGLRERQMRGVFKMAHRQDGVTGDNLLILLESRLDNVVFRMRWAATRDQARQLVRHGHVKVNGRRVNVPSFGVSENDKISVKDSPRSQALIRRYIEESSGRPTVEWLESDNDKLVGQVIRLPLRDEIQCDANEQLVVELLSK